MKYRILVLTLGFLLLSAVVVQAAGTDTVKEQRTTLVWICVFSLASLGICFGLGLAVAAQLLAVETDARIEKINALLPGAQCGACGFPGCFQFAEAVVAGTADPTGCRCASAEVTSRIGALLGLSLEATSPPVATVLCTRQQEVAPRYIYTGPQDCRALMVTGQNLYVCDHACIGLGSCVAACPWGAIIMDSAQMPQVDPQQCTGCGLCVQTCPVGVLRLVPRTHHIHILCVSHSPGRDTNKAHKGRGCIACRKCVKVCPQQAIVIENNLAVMQYDRCDQCGKCVSVCPNQVIRNLAPARQPVEAGA